MTNVVAAPTIPPATGAANFPPIPGSTRIRDITDIHGTYQRHLTPIAGPDTQPERPIFFAKRLLRLSSSPSFMECDRTPRNHTRLRTIVTPAGEDSLRESHIVIATEGTTSRPTPLTTAMWIGNKTPLHPTLWSTCARTPLFASTNTAGQACARHLDRHLRQHMHSSYARAIPQPIDVACIRGQAHREQNTHRDTR